MLWDSLGFFQRRGHNPCRLGALYQGTYVRTCVYTYVLQRHGCNLYRPGALYQGTYVRTYVCVYEGTHVRLCVCTWTVGQTTWSYGALYQGIHTATHTATHTTAHTATHTATHTRHVGALHQDMYVFIYVRMSGWCALWNYAHCSKLWKSLKPIFIAAQTASHTATQTVTHTVTHASHFRTLHQSTYVRTYISFGAPSRH